jgi:hypothetical protein
MRLTDFTAGDIKKMFEAELPFRSDNKDDEVTKALDELHRKHQRIESSLSGRQSLKGDIIQLRSTNLCQPSSTPSRDEIEGRNRNTSGRRDQDEVTRLRGSHLQKVRWNNLRIKTEGPRFTPPWRMSWDELVDRGGTRGNDGIPMTDHERSQLTSGRGLFGG